MMNRRAFERLNAEREERGLSRFANPRNAAAGSLRVLEPQNHRRSAGWSTTLISCSPDGRPIVDSHWQSLEELGRHGFKVNPHRRICHDVDEVVAFCDPGRTSARACPTRSTAWW